MLTIDAKLMGNTCFYIQSENSPNYVIHLKKYHWKKRKHIKNILGFEEEIWDEKLFEIRYWQIWYFKLCKTQNK
jgi:hypothetical protein